MAGGPFPGAIVWHSGHAGSRLRVTIRGAKLPYGAQGAIRVHQEVDTLLAEARRLAGAGLQPRLAAAVIAATVQAPGVQPSMRASALAFLRSVRDSQNWQAFVDTLESLQGGRLTDRSTADGRTTEITGTTSDGRTATVEVLCLGDEISCAGVYVEKVFPPGQIVHGAVSRVEALATHHD